MNAQVNFTNDPNAGLSVDTNNQVIMYVTNKSETAGVKGFGLPAVQTETDLPYTGVNAPSVKIEILRGMLLFVKDTGQAMVFDGLVWSKAFEVEADNISRFQIDTISTTSGVALLPINSLIDKANYIADPLKLKTNLGNAGTDYNRLYIRQTGVYRINIKLNLTGPNSSFNKRLGAGLYVNDVKKLELLEGAVNHDGTNMRVNLDFSIYAMQGDYITLKAISEMQGTSYSVTNSSYVTVEKIL